MSAAASAVLVEIPALKGSHGNKENKAEYPEHECGEPDHLVIGFETEHHFNTPINQSNQGDDNDKEQGNGYKGDIGP